MLPVALPLFPRPVPTLQSVGGGHQLIYERITDSDASYSLQIILLILLNTLMLVWLRIIRPSGDRTELIMAMLGVLSSLGVYICGLILLANPNGGPGFRWAAPQES